MQQPPRGTFATANKNNVPWFDRRILEGLTTQFGPNQRDRFTVYLTQDAVMDLHIGTYQQIPSEAFGLLMGRVYIDDAGSFTVVERVFYARELEASPGHVQLSPEKIHELRLQATRKHPALDFVGWTHSHDRPSQYSNTDFQEQHTWDDPSHVGILTFMDGVIGAGKTWAILYRGPTAQLLPLVLDATPVLRKNNKLPPIMANEKQTVQEPEKPQEKTNEQCLTTTQPDLVPEKSQTDSSKKPVRRLPNWFSWKPDKRVFATLLLTILALALVIVGVVAGNVLTLLWQPIIPASSSTSLLWDCNQQSSSTPRSVTCTGPIGPNIQDWAWDFGDGTTIQKNTVTHVYQKAGTYKITLIVTTFANQHTVVHTINAGSLTIQVAP